MYIASVDMGRDRTRTNLSYIFQTFGIPNTMIEIGSFEGITTSWVTQQCKLFNHNFKIYAIDPHTTENNNDSFDFEIIQKTFEFNISKFTDSIVYINKHSHAALVDLIQKKVQADLIFVDGDHSAAAVLEDLILSWRLLPVGGVILCDDMIGWKLIDKHGNIPVQLSPRMGIEMFIQVNWHKIELIHLPDSYQIAFKKIID